MSESIDFTTLDSLWQAYDELIPSHRFTAENQEAWEEWREELLAHIKAILGTMPPQKPTRKAQILQSEMLPHYRLEKAALPVEEAIEAPCYVLTPHHVDPPYRPVIALHGHGSGGASHLIGRVRSEETRSAEEGHIAAHNYDYAHQLALKGFMVFAPEQRGFGERMETYEGMTLGDAMWRSSCRSLAFNALLMGRTILGMRVWDVQRTIDYIAARPEEISPKVGCVGLSGGGTTTLYAALMEPRIFAPVISGAFGSFRRSIMETMHCDCNYLPGILKVAEMADLAAAIAPRPLLIEAGTEDPIFPVDSVRQANEEVARVYRLLGVPERFDEDIFEGGHRFSGAKSFDWFDHWL